MSVTVSTFSTMCVYITYTRDCERNWIQCNMFQTEINNSTR